MSEREHRDFITDDCDQGKETLRVSSGGNGDWYVTILADPKHKIGPTVRVTTSGTRREYEHVPMALFRLWEALGGKGPPTFASMADGVAPADVYPCDIERAFKALDRIKPHVSHWIDSTAQTVSLIQSNETDYTFTFTTRVKGMQESGVPMGYSFEQNLMGMVYTAVPTGAPNSDGAMRLLSYIMDPERQVEMANGSGDAPTYISSLEKVDPAVRKWLPDVANENNMMVDGDWWAANIDELGPRMKEWLLT